MKHLITQSLDGEPGAILSDCEQYRYRLWRESGPLPAGPRLHHAQPIDRQPPGQRDP
ncbi:hypothetical protein ACU4GD_02985 [Cupriavidus basilensis]